MELKKLLDTQICRMLHSFKSNKSTKLINGYNLWNALNVVIQHSDSRIILELIQKNYLMLMVYVIVMDVALNSII